MNHVIQYDLFSFIDVWGFLIKFGFITAQYSWVAPDDFIVDTT